VRLRDANAIVTGGASGLGLSAARELLQRGAHVTIVDRKESPGPEVARQLGDRARFVAADVTAEGELPGAITEARADGPDGDSRGACGRGWRRPSPTPAGSVTPPSSATSP
jgi:NAD(P)-dependent dehydrogenase (short-subunit alcohol dehydrogenase family)